MKHSPQIQLASARRELELARDNCSHWDYEADEPAGHSCCHDLARAKDSYRKARHAFDRVV